MESSEIQIQIDRLASELQTLRLPHKLKQYRQYEKRLQSILKNVEQTNANNKNSLEQQLNELCVKLDKSVICGVDQCFICGPGSTGTSSTNHHPAFVNNKTNHQNNKTNISLATLSTTSSATTIPPQMVTSSTIHSNHCYNNHQENQHQKETKVTNENVSPCSNNVQTDQTKATTMASSVNETIGIKETTEIVMNKQSEQINGIQNNEIIVHNPQPLNNLDSNITVVKQTKHEQPIENNSQKADVSPSIDEGNKQTSLKQNISPLMMSPRPYQKVIHNGPSSSYKAYKDFINNYTSTATIAQSKN